MVENSRYFVMVSNSFRSWFTSGAMKRNDTTLYNVPSSLKSGWYNNTLLNFKCWDVINIPVAQWWWETTIDDEAGI